MSNITNQELADIFDKIGNLLEIKGEVIYKTLAYRRAADSLRANAAEAATLDTQDRLQEIPGVGKAIAEKIHEILTTGKLEFLVRLENEVPPSLVDLLEVPDIGPKKVAMFWKQANITTLAELETPPVKGNCASCPGWVKNLKPAFWMGSMP